MMDQSSITNVYKRYAGVYDYVFGRVLHTGRQSVITEMNCQGGEKVLEVGAGTGLSLPLYPRDTSVIAIDISPHMLAKAEKRIKMRRLHNVHLEVMDAQSLQFAQDTFDKVVAMYVASVVPNPQLVITEMKRVCKPQGDLFIVNHFSHTYPFVRKCEHWVSPLSRYVGFRPDFSLEKFIATTQLEVVNITPTNAFGYWSIIHAKNNKRTH